MRLLSKLHVQLFLAIAAGILVGVIRPNWAEHLKPLGDLFVGLIRLLLAPVVFSTVTLGIARSSGVKSVGRTGLKALVYFELVSTFALVIGLIVGNVFQPGAQMKFDSTFTFYAPYQASLLYRLVHPNVLVVILISICLGILLSRLPHKQPVMNVMEKLLSISFRLVRIVTYVAPPAAFGAMAYVIGKYGAGQLLPYAKLMACIYGTSLLFIACVLAPIAHLSGFSLWRFLRFVLDEILIVFGTCSTESVLPQMMIKLEKLGCEPSLIGMVLPAGYAFNADGTSIYLTLALLFIAQATKTPLPLHDQLTLLLVALVTSKGTAGVAGAGLVTLAATLLAAQNQIPLAGLSLVLGIDSLLNQARAVTNVIGNGVATMAIARWEGLLDTDKLAAVLRRPD